MIVAAFSGESPRRPGRKAPIAAIGTALATNAAHDLVRPLDHLRRGLPAVQQRALGLELELEQDLRRGDDVPQARLVDGRVDDLLAGGVVQVDGDLAQQRDARLATAEGTIGGSRRPTFGPSAQLPAQGAAQGQGAEERLAVGEARAGAVGDGRGVRAFPGSVDEGAGRATASAGGRAAAGISGPSTAGPAGGGQSARSWGPQATVGISGHSKRSQVIEQFPPDDRYSRRSGGAGEGPQLLGEGTGQVGESQGLRGVEVGVEHRPLGGDAIAQEAQAVAQARVVAGRAPLADRPTRPTDRVGQAQRRDRLGGGPSTSCQASAIAARGETSASLPVAPGLVDRVGHAATSGRGPAPSGRSARAWPSSRPAAGAASVAETRALAASRPSLKFSSKLRYFSETRRPKLSFSSTRYSVARPRMTTGQDRFLTNSTSCNMGETFRSQGRSRPRRGDRPPHQTSKSGPSTNCRNRKAPAALFPDGIPGENGARRLPGRAGSGRIEDARDLCRPGRPTMNSLKGHFLIAVAGPGDALLHQDGDPDAGARPGRGDGRGGQPPDRGHRRRRRRPGLRRALRLGQVDRPGRPRPRPLDGDPRGRGPRRPRGDPRRLQQRRGRESPAAPPRPGRAVADRGELRGMGPRPARRRVRRGLVADPARHAPSTSSGRALATSGMWSSRRSTPASSRSSSACATCPPTRP